jgi:hypothetical protein
MKAYSAGEIVRIDADTKEWGRVVGKAEVLEESSKSRKTVLVCAEMVRANILIRKEEVQS